MAPKSIWRKPGAQHFQLVHRSQRDPLINDPDAGQHVLKQYSHLNDRKGKSRAELEEELGLPAGGKQADRPNVGEAALYGVYFDDTKYDYMQHLRPIGGGYNAARGGKDEEDDVEAVWLEAPKGQAAKGKGTTKREGDGGFTLREDAERRAAEDTKGKGKHREDGLDLPASVLPSKEERPFSYAAQLGVEPGLAGLQPDMDPHLRQVLEALDDEAFVDGDADDDFFAGVIDGGEWNEDESQAEEDWRALPPEGDERMWMDGAQRTQTEAGAVGGDGELSLEARVALFKKAQAQAAAMAAADGGESVGVSSDGEEGDALGHLPSLKAPGARARRAASSRAGSVAGSKAGSAFSMSSSAMFRNEGLTTLDARFDKIEREYEQVSDSDSDALSDFDDDDDMASAAGETEGGGVIREDFDSIMNDFLDKYEVLGGKMRPSLGGSAATPADKLELVRRALGEARIKERKEGDEESDEEPMPEPRVVGENKEKWDAETILTTRTNLENHPRMIRTRDSTRGSVAPPSSIYGKPGSLSSSSIGAEERLPKIRINPRTGFPEIVGYTRPRGPKKHDGANGSTQDGSEAASKELDDMDGRGPPSEDESDAASDATEGPRNVTIARDRNESKEVRKARKQAVKEEKQARRADKAAFKASFANERKRQTKAAQARVAGGAAADVGRNGVANGGTMRLL